MSMGDFSKPERRRLDSIGTLWFKGQPFKKTDIVETGKYPCLHYGELFSKYGAIIDSVSSRCDVFPKRLSQKGDILFPASDVTPAGLTRCSAIMQENVILGGDVIGFRPQTGLNPIYLSYAIRHQKTQLLQRVTGALIKHISAKSLQSIIIPIHPIERQDRFEKQVRHLNRIISHRRTQLAKLDELVKCRFVELFGEPLAPKAKWKTTSFGSEFEIFSGGTPSTSVSEYWDNGTIPWIGSNMCQDVILSSTDGKYITEEGFNKSSAKWAHAGYVIVALVGATIGKTALLTISTTTNQNVASVNVPGNTNYTPEYVYMLMRFLYAKFMELGNGGFKMANLGFIRQLPLPSPPIDLQREYSDFMNRIDKLRFSVQASLDKTQQLFDSLMQEYFG